MSALSYLQWWGGRALPIGGTGNGKKEKKRDGKGEGKEREREESKKEGYGLEIAVHTQCMHELVKK